MMELRFLGRGAAFHTAEGNTAAFVRKGSSLLLLDCGETVFPKLAELGILQGVTRLYAAISHLHSDHCGSLGTLAHYCRYVLGRPLTLLLPEHEEYCGQLMQLMRFFGHREGSYDLLPAKDWQGMGLIRKLRYVPTVHAPGMHCFSFVLETDRGGVFYSADTCSTQALEDFLAAHDHIAGIYMDACDGDYPGNIHLPVTKLAAVLPADLRCRTWLMHLSGPAAVEAGEALGFRIADIFSDTSCNMDISTL